MPYLYLLIAVVFEIVGTSALQSSQQFTRLGPSIVVLVGFAGAMYFLALTLQYMPLGVVYAIWSGVGIVLIAAISFFWFRQAVDLPAIIGLTLIIAGIVIIQLFSNTSVH
jgi:small multidrug resistance pump